MAFSTFDAFVVVDPRTLAPVAGVAGTITDAATGNLVSLYDMSGNPVNVVSTNIRGYVGAFRTDSSVARVECRFGEHALVKTSAEAIAEAAALGGRMASAEAKDFEQDIRLNNLDVAAGFAPGDVSDATVASHVGSAPSETRHALYRIFPRVVNVEAYGAVSIGYADAATDIQRGTNDAAFLAAWNDVIQTGGQLYIPPGFWPVNRIVWDAVGTVNVHIEAPLATVLVDGPDAAVPTAAGDDGVFLGSSAAEYGKPTTTFLRRVSVRGLNIQGHKDPTIGAAGKIDRKGLHLKGLQELRVDDVWVSGFSYQGAHFDAVWDSTAIDLRVMWCGNSAPTADSDLDPSLNRYAVEVRSTILNDSQTLRENSNALRFYGLHVEKASLMLLMRDRARHIHFTDCKLEMGQTNWSELQPIFFDEVWEVDFKGGMVVQNVVDLISGQQPAHVIGSANYLDSGNLNTSEKKNVVFTGTHLTTPAGGAALWFTGSQVTFRDCDFGKTYSLPGRAAFELGNGSKILGGSVTFAQTIPANGSATPRQDFVRFYAAGAKVKDVTLYCADGTVPGTLVTIGAGAQLNEFEMRGSQWGLPPSMWAHEGGANNFGTNRVDVIRDPSVDDILVPGAPDVFGRYSARLDPGTYTDFLGGYTGQRLLLRARGALTLTDVSNGSGIITGTGADLSVPSGSAVSIQRIPTHWVVC